MNDIEMHLVGNVASEVELHHTSGGYVVARFRLAVGTKRVDSTTHQLVDGSTQFFSVSCWRDLGENVATSISKGMPVIVFGRMRSKSIDRPCGVSSHSVRYYDVEATSVGIDLAKGTVEFTRVKPASVRRQEQRAIDEALGAAGSAA